MSIGVQLLPIFLQFMPVFNWSEFVRLHVKQCLEVLWLLFSAVVRTEYTLICVNDSDDLISIATAGACTCRC